MLTRLRVKGFKNLVDTELRFGPLTCIAGLNGVGKSNIFDAIRFLSLLADRPFVEAAREIRGGGNIVELFTVGGDGKIEFECDVLIGSKGQDDFAQPAEASHTYLRYQLVLELISDENSLPRIRLRSETLGYIPKGDARSTLGFPHTKAWMDSVLPSSTRRVQFISTEGVGDDAVVRLSSDKMRDDAKSKRGGGRPADFPASRLPRTVLSSAQNADEARTAVLLRAEMRTWRILQLEPSALRRADDLQDPQQISSSGAHIPATLFRLASEYPPLTIYAEVANRLSDLVADVREVRVDRDDARRWLRFMMTDKNGVELPASSLSDGTMRFVALAVIDLDPMATGVLCFEEPENGIHPERLDAMMRLLQDMAVDVTVEVGIDNPLRQVIVSTHSPVVAAGAHFDVLVFAVPTESLGPNGNRLKTIQFRAMERSWRVKLGARPIARGKVISYLGTVPNSMRDDERKERVFDMVGEQLRLFPEIAG